MASTTSGIKGPGEAQTYDGSPLRIAILHARWNTTLISALLSGVLSTLKAQGVRDENITIQSVPGSYELPFAAQKMIAAGQHQAASAAISNATGGVASAGRGLLESATDLLGGSVTDLKALDVNEKDKDAPPPGPKANEKDAGKSEVNAQPFDALIAIGALIKGSTMHFEYISGAVSEGLMRVQMETGTPVVFGLLTLLTEEQGMERAGIEGKWGKGHNHGEDWGAAAVELGVKGRGWAKGEFVK